MKKIKTALISVSNKKNLDILKLSSIDKCIKREKPKYVLHTAGLSRPMNVHEKNISKSWMKT